MTQPTEPAAVAAAFARAAASDMTFLLTVTAVGGGGATFSGMRQGSTVVEGPYAAVEFGALGPYLAQAGDVTVCLRVGAGAVGVGRISGP